MSRSKKPDQKPPALSTLSEGDGGKRDTLFNRSHEMAVGDFAFNKQVVDVFPDMISRSVPGYSSIVHMAGQLASRYAQAHSRCYDLGCSLGASSLAMRKELQARESDNNGLEIVCVDNSEAMIEKLRQRLSAEATDASLANIPINLHCADIQAFPIQNASVVVMNFTLQFIPVQERMALLNKISSGLLPGGILILSEKLAFENHHHHSLMTELHHNFKRAQGYSELEISRKRQALENVLLPESFPVHEERLQSAGFTSVVKWFQCFNFASMIAFK